MKVIGIANVIRKGDTLFADVEVVSGIWPFRRYDVVKIYRPLGSGIWRLLSNGKPVYDSCVCQMEEALLAKRMLAA